jgi:glucose 1-dehydrogenase
MNGLLRSSLPLRGVGRLSVLAGKVAIVTGASRGIGRAIALAFAEAGCDVAVNYRSSAAEADELAGRIRQLGGRALVVHCDVAKQSSVEEMVADTVRQFGRLDIAVSNAAYSDREPFYEADMDGFRRTVDVTMWGAFYLLRAATRQMIKQGGGGSIIVISSPHAFVAVPRSMAYNMSKAAIDHMARTAAIELVEHRIRVNLIHPGWIDTPGERKFASEEQLANAAAKLPWKRMGRPEEIARGVVFLCDPASDYITGSSLAIDGGITLPWWANRGSAVPE